VLKQAQFPVLIQQCLAIHLPQHMMLFARSAALLACIHCLYLADVARGFTMPTSSLHKHLHVRGGASATAAAPVKATKTDAVEGIKQGLASGLASCCVKTLLQPLDTIKTVQQFSTQSLSFFEAGRLLLARSGVPALYSGLGVTLLGAAPSMAIYFGIYGYCRRKFDSLPQLSRTASIAFSAGIGNFVARLVLYTCTMYLDCCSCSWWNR
jgi:Mitochondrial carrier protein